LDLARVLLLESALSYLGLGAQPPTPSWGAMIADGSQHLYDAWYVSALPGVAIVIAVVALNLLGDGLRDALDPLTRQS
jgi:peptide/nickel transport system permease protein